uniref:Uncharacterized protein n=1 Tax=Physcomitrium patens TaxID=3218 RepID=A0A2K1ICJ9_PHYPA|nr:hypothetical protein PHYPA_030486 [Physcomitrium patens]
MALACTHPFVFESFQVVTISPVDTFSLQNGRVEDRVCKWACLCKFCLLVWSFGVAEALLF